MRLIDLCNGFFADSLTLAVFPSSFLHPGFTVAAILQSPPVCILRAPYVRHTSAHSVRVSTVCGGGGKQANVLPSSSFGLAGFVDGSASDARFSSPSHLILQSSSSSSSSDHAAAVALFVSDRDNHAIRKIQLIDGGRVTTIACRESNRPSQKSLLAASASSSSSSSSSPPSSTSSLPLFLPLHSPAGLILDPQSHGSWLLVCDGTHVIRKLWLASSSTATTTPTLPPKYSLWAGGGGNVSQDGEENEGDDEMPSLPAVEPETTTANSSSSSSSSARPMTARRRMAAASTQDRPSPSSGSRPSTASSSGRSAAPAAVTLATPSIPALSARFSRPAGLCWDASQSLLLCDRGNSKLKRVSPTGLLLHIVGGSSSSSDLPYDLRLLRPECVIMDGRGSIIFSDTGNHCIKRLSPDGILSILAGGCGSDGGNSGSSGGKRQGVAGFRDGSSTRALFNQPFGLALEPQSGAIFVADEANHAIRMITTAGYVTTIAGGGGNGIEVDAASSGAITARPTTASSQRSYSGRAPPAASYSHSSSSTLNTASLAVGDDGENRESIEGFADGVGTAALFFRPQGIAFDSASRTLFVADSGNNAIRRITIERVDETTQKDDTDASFAQLVPDDPFPSARLMHTTQPPSSQSVGGLNRYASMPSFRSPLTARGGSSSDIAASSIPRPNSSETRKSSAAAPSSSSSSLLSPAALPADPRSWSRLDVCFWLVGLSPSFESYVSGFLAARIDGQMLLDRFADHKPLQEEAGVASKTHRNAIVRGILRLKNPGAAEEEQDESEEDELESKSGSDSRVSSASGTRPTRPMTASGWRPSAASAAISAAAESFITNLHLEDAPAATAAPASAANASPPTFAAAASSHSLRPLVLKERALDVPASSAPA